MSVSAVVATRGRPESAARAVGSILACDPPPLEVVVVDQSPDGATEEALGPLRRQGALRYHRSTTTGLSCARNEAVRIASGDLVAITDDDCEVPPDWIERVVEAFVGDQRTAIVFGNVVPARFDAAVGFIPGYVRAEPFLADGPDKKPDIDGIGACMALRRSVWEELGGFDQMLGAGTAFPGGEEGDVAMRALAAGWFVLETPRFWVEHHGYRTRAQGEQTMFSYARGTGAMMAKHLRCRTPGTGRLLAAMAWRWSRGALHPTATVGGGRHRVRRLRAFTTGLVAGARAPVDRAAVLFVDDGRRVGG